jgi:hypothetical protein
MGIDKTEWKRRVFESAESGPKCSGAYSVLLDEFDNSFL